MSEKPKEITYSEKTAALSHSISDIGISREEKNISSKVTPVQITDPLSAAYQDYTQTENAIAEIPESIEKNSVIPVLPGRNRLWLSVQYYTADSN